jgi:hypothetical protein
MITLFSEVFEESIYIYDHKSIILCLLLLFSKMPSLLMAVVDSHVMVIALPPYPCGSSIHICHQGSLNAHLLPF